MVGEDGEEVERTTNFMGAKFHFVDLAGSERANRTGNAGERFKGEYRIYSNKRPGASTFISQISRLISQISRLKHQFSTKFVFSMMKKYILSIKTEQF